VNPYTNLAIEQYLFENVDDDTLVVYLWQNQNTVVIGKNQNAYSECRAELLKSDGCFLARRTSGGGAVFHDLGNLNFTFICSTENFDVAKHMQVIHGACRLSNIDAEISGRNDILADGRKFSGNAFYNSRGRSYHHGTILINADVEKVDKYLTPPKAKLEARGVKSVRSRVINLCEFAPSLTCETMKDHLLSAAETVYALSPEMIKEIDCAQINALATRFADWEYIYGSPIPFNLSCGGRLSFGNAEIALCVKNGYITDLKLYTDALDHEISNTVRETLVALPFELSVISDALFAAINEADAIALVKLFSEQIFT
jgi:lipoate-protein ligase A